MTDSSDPVRKAADVTTSFDVVADDYAEARPAYPGALFDALEPLRDLRVVDGGAGTGIATAALVARGAQVIAFDLGPAMLRHAVARLPGLPALVADGASTPFRSASVDLVCWAQAWHWVSAEERAAEAARILKPGGRWAGWWSHPRADGEPWFDHYWDVLEDRCPTTNRSHRDLDWGAELAATPYFVVTPRQVFAWIRRVSVEQWLTDERSKSYVAALPAPGRAELLDELEGILRDAFPSGTVEVAYETWLWVATRVGTVDGPGEQHS
jgi:SAM-dependent methyltransferase